MYSPIILAAAGLHLPGYTFAPFGDLLLKVLDAFESEYNVSD